MTGRLGCVILALAGALTADSAVGVPYLTDRLAHAPPAYDSFLPPPQEGGAYVDPVFGTRITRLSDASRHRSPWSGKPWALAGNEWSAVNALNAGNTKVLLLTGGPATVWSATGGLLARLNDDYPVSALGFRWSHSDPDLLYFAEPEDAYYTGPDAPGPSSIRSLNLRTRAIKVLRTFPQYRRLSFTGEDLSPDGDYLPILANGRHAFWYRISDDTVGPVVDRVSRYGYAPGEKGSQYMLGEVFVMANFHATPPGLVVLDGKTMAHKLDTRSIDHRAFGLDVDGTPIAVMAHWEGCRPETHAVNKVDLRTGATHLVTCLPLRAGSTDFYYSIAHRAPGWVLVTLVDTRADGTPPQDWLPFENEIFLLRLDGGEVRRLAHHRGRPHGKPPDMPYWARPKAAIGLDGTRAVFGSNYGLLAPSPTSDPSYQDAYLIDLGAAAPPARGRSGPRRRALRTGSRGTATTGPRR